MTAVPAQGPHRAQSDGSLSGAPRRALPKQAKHFAVLAGGNGGWSIALVDATKGRIEAGIGLAATIPIP